MTGRDPGGTAPITMDRSIHLGRERVTQASIRSADDEAMPEKARTSRTIFSQVELGHPWLFALATILACAGCGGGSQGASDGGGADLAPFLGTWSCEGTQIEVCGAASHTDTTDFAIDIVKGTSPNGIAAEPAGDAGNTGGTANSAGALDWTVSGSTATIDSPMTLPTVPGSVGGTWTPTYSGGLLSRNGAALIWTTSGSAVYVNGVTETCSFTQSYECSTENASSGGDASVPVDAPSEKTTVAVSMGSGFACLVTDQSGIQCWGDDTYGELGNATGSSDGVPAPVTGLASGGASVSAGGNGSACAVTTLGSVVCWGASADGELGNGGSTSNTSVPTEVTGLTSGITAVSVGEGSDRKSVV